MPDDDDTDEFVPADPLVELSPCDRCGKADTLFTWGGRESGTLLERLCEDCHDAAASQEK